MDHFTALPLLVDSIFDTIKEPIVIHGQPKTIEALKTHIFNWVIWPDFARLPTEDKPVMRYEEMRPGEIYELQDRTFEMIGVNHIVPGVGYRVSCPSGAFAFSGDTTTTDGFWEVLNARPNLDLLIVEAAFANSEQELSIKAGHYTPNLLGADIAKLKHQPQVYLSHTKPGQEELIVHECNQAISNRDIYPLYGGEEFTL
jgi:ribonuclease BN (tRNA processing enzyme)